MLTERSPARPGGRPGQGRWEDAIVIALGTSVATMGCVGAWCRKFKQFETGMALGFGLQEHDTRAIATQGVF